MHQYRVFLNIFWRSLMSFIMPISAPLVLLRFRIEFLYVQFYVTYKKNLSKHKKFFQIISDSVPKVSFTCNPYIFFPHSARSSSRPSQPAAQRYRKYAKKPKGKSQKEAQKKLCLLFWWDLYTISYTNLWNRINNILA